MQTFDVELKGLEDAQRPDLIYKDAWVDEKGIYHLGKPFIGKETFSVIPGPLLSGLLYTINNKAFEAGRDNIRAEIAKVLGVVRK